LKTTLEILYLQQEDVLQAGLMDMDAVLEKVEKAYKMHGNNQIINPVKTMINIPEPNEEWKSRFISMPVYIGGDENIAGIKWAAESRNNPKKGQLPMGIDVIILSDPDTVAPLSIMDGTLITAMRTAASTGIAAKYLADKSSTVLACIGAGVIGRTTIIALKKVLPNIEKVQLYDINIDKARFLADELKDFVKIETASSVEEAVRDADIVTTMTTSKKPFVKHSWLNKATLFLQIGSHEACEDVILASEKIVVDDWEPIQKDPSMIFKKLLNKKIIDKKNIVNLREIVCGRLENIREKNEFIFFKSRGLGCLDIMVAKKIYQTAKSKGIGSKLKLWDTPKWI